MENSHSDPTMNLKQSSVEERTEGIEDSIHSSFQKSLSDAITLELVTDLGRISKLKEEWKTLYSAIASHDIRQGYEWINTAYEQAIDRDYDIEVVVLIGRHAGRICLILPLTRHMRNGVVHLQYVEADDGQCGAVLLENHPAVQDWLDRAFIYLISDVEWDSLVLKDVAKQSLFLTFLRGCKALCLESNGGKTYTCVLSRNFIGQAYCGLLQGHMAFHRFYDYLRSAYASFL